MARPVHSKKPTHRLQHPHPARQPITVALVSLGCPKNLVDSEKMLGLLAESGIAPTPNPADADVIIINTCGFLEAAKQESLEAIARAARFKRTGRASRVVVAGCLATRMGVKILRDVPGVDALVGVHQREQIVEAVVGRASDPPSLFLGRYHPHVDLDAARLRLTPRHYAYLRISEGCSRGCSFCTIPSIRGPMRSKPADAVVAEAKELLADGALELNLIGQDTTGYGADLPPSNGRLANLLRRLDRLPGVRWLRLLYAYPNEFGDDVIDAMAECQHVVPYVDLPLQHINDRVLARMKRRVTRGQIESLLEKLRARVPGLAIRTTFITGFPGETEAEHRELLAFVEKFRFDMMGVFGYSQEPGTPAGRMPDQVADAVKRARRAELMEAQQRIVLRRNAGLIGAEATALIDRWVTPQMLSARTPGQAPEVDSVTLIPIRESTDASVRGPEKIPPVPGQLLPIRITGYRGYDLLAEAPKNFRKRDSMKAALPNLITSVRFVLALVFFVLMENYQHGTSPVIVLDWAFGIFVFTAVTDILDGYLARRWKQESTFGRILDPLVDKVLIIGAFLYLASDHFVTLAGHPAPPGATVLHLRHGLAVVGASGVAVWMVALILIRELLVTGLRGFSEAQGLSFKATIPGKIKMFVQCVAAGTVMVVTGHAEHWYPGEHWPYLLRDSLLWLMVIVTTFSMLVYLERARTLLTKGLRGREKKKAADEASPD